jgi:protocatechuate 3,4-dioxygenase beta subunit
MKTNSYWISLFVLLAWLAAACAAPAPTDVSAPAGQNVTDIQPADGNAGSNAADTEEVDTPSGGESGAAFPAAVTARGDVIILTGAVVDVYGSPVEGAAVEIWQTDESGVYDHPGDPGTAGRDPGFQFYGTSITNADGAFSFRTIVPGQYEPRTPHIHFKVKLDGVTLLTSQFYFAANAAQNQNDGIASNADSSQLLNLVMVEGVDFPVAHTTVVIDTGIGAGSLTPTMQQTEGPYYPLADVSAFDNDLTAVP